MSAGQLRAFDSKTVSYVTIQVVDHNDGPVVGAVVRVLPQAGDEEYFAQRPMAKKLGSWSALQERGFATNELGIATAPFIAGEFDHVEGQKGVTTGLPREIVISAKGYVTLRLKFSQDSYFRLYSMSLFHSYYLTPLKKGEAAREEEFVTTFKAPLVPEK